MVNIELIKVNIDELISPIWNPRKISKREKEKLRKSINEYGYISPIIINKHNNHIIGGNQRVAILKELGYTEIDVVYINEPNLDKEKALNLSLNKINGEWDNSKLEDLLVDLELNEVDLDLTGFDKLDFKEFDFNLKFPTPTPKEPQEKGIIEEVIITTETLDKPIQSTESFEEENLFDSIKYTDNTVTIYGEEEPTTQETEETIETQKQDNTLQYEKPTITQTEKDKINQILEEKYQILLTFNNKKELEKTIKKIKTDHTINCTIKII